MDLLSHEKHQAYGLSSVIAREWKLYQKWSCKFIKNPQWPTGKRSLRLLRQLKCLTALKNLLKVSEFYRYDALNLLSYMTLDVKNIHSVVFLVRMAGLKNPIGNPLFYEPIPTTFPLKLATLLNNPLQKFPFSLRCLRLSLSHKINFSIKIEKKNNLILEERYFDKDY